MYIGKVRSKTANLSVQPICIAIQLSERSLMNTTVPALKPQTGMLQGREWRTDRFLQLAPSRLWMLTAICGVALGVSGYLAYASLMTGDVVGCGSGDVWNCGNVLTSRWSKFLGLPVSVIAAGLYSVLLGCLLTLQMSTAGNRRRFAWSLLTIGAVSAGLAAIWFISLQAFAVGRLCIYCEVAHACGMALCGCSWWRPLGTRTTAMLSGVSVLAVSVLIGGQLLATPPDTFKIERFDDQPTTGGNASDEQHDPDQKRDVEIFEPF